MSKMRPNAERSMPMEERHFSMGSREARGVDRKLGFFWRALVELTLRWFSR